MSDPRIVMALKVRDEEDILADNLRYHVAQGVDAFVVTDNDSRDRTPEILAEYESAGRARVIQESGTHLLSEGHEWVTRMARLAATEMEADWVIYADADEFWWPLEGSLRDVLGAVPDSYGVLVGPRAEFVARPDGPGPFFERMTVRERRALLRPKVAHRANPNAVVLHEGGHDVAFVEPGADLRSALRPPGRAVLRGARESETPADGEPVWAPIFPARILHFPVRSLEQFRRRVDIALMHEAPDPSSGKLARLRERYETEGVEALYAEIACDDAEVEAGIRERRLVSDTRLQDFLSAAPDPLAPGGEHNRPTPPPPEDLERERSELERDAMAALARHARLTEVRMDSSRERLREIGVRWNEMERTAKRQTAKARRRLERVERLQGKVQRLRAELRRERRRPWSRLRNLRR